jgi:hypothetical protein
MFRSAGLRYGTMGNMPGRKPALPLRAAGNDRRSAGVLARDSADISAQAKVHTIRPAKIAAPEDGRTPAAGGKCRTGR